MSEFVRTIVKFQVGDKEFYTEEAAHSYLLEMKKKEKAAEVEKTKTKNKETPI